MSQDELESLLTASVYPLDNEIANMNWNSVMRYGNRRADRSWRAGFFFGALFMFVVVAVGFAMARL